MLIKDSTWERVRAKFTEPEKERLRDNVTGTSICPRGICVDESKLSDALRVKLFSLIREKQSL